MKSNRKIIIDAILRYFEACDEVNGEMMVEYAAECAGLPTEPVTAKDTANITRNLRKLRAAGRLNYEFKNGKYKKI